MRHHPSQTQPTPFGHPAFIQDYGAAWSGGDLLSSWFSEDGQYVESSYGNTYTGRDEIRRFVRFMFAFSQDSCIEFVNICGDERLFTMEWVWSGTATGPIRIEGLVHPASGLPYRIPGVAVCRADSHGKVTYHRDYYDLLTLMRQLGIRSSGST